MVSEMDTCPKNDVISFFRKRVCFLGLGVELGLRLGLKVSNIRLNTFSVKRPFGQMF